MIYDLSKKSYKDKIAKDNAWKRIATDLERDGKFSVIFCSFYIVLIFKILATHKRKLQFTLITFTLVKVFTFLFFN